MFTEIFRYLVNVCVLEAGQLFTHRLEVHRTFDVSQIIGHIIQTDRFSEDLLYVNLLQHVHQPPQKVEERETLQLRDLVHGIDQFPFSLLSLTYQLAEKSNAFKVLSEASQKLSLVEHVSELVFGFLEDGGGEGQGGLFLLIFLQLLLLVLVVVCVFLRGLGSPVGSSCFGKLKSKIIFNFFPLLCFFDTQ